MAFVLADRVKETTTTTGTGDISLGGAETNFVAFGTALSDADTTYYAIVDDVNADFEIGIGTYTSGTDTLSRDTILDSTNAGSAVNFGAGVKSIFITYPAEKSVRVDSTGVVTLASSVLTTTDINGGTIDGTVIGGASEANATFVDVQIDSLGVGTPASGTTGEIRATNNVTAFYSDRRLKENIKLISDALTKLNSISGVMFTPNEVAAGYGYDTSKNYPGVIAQEIKAVLPEAVVPAPFDTSYDEDGKEYSVSGENYMTVQYEKLIPLLIEAIKELDKKVTMLREK